MSEKTENPQAPAFEPSPEFLARQKRLGDARSLQKPDRVPVAPLVVTFYPTRAKGISNKEAMYNVGRTYDVWKETTIKHEWDAAPPATALLPARPLEIMGMQQFKWPGGGLKEDQPFQWVEGEYMMQDEYDEMLADPNGFTVKKLWPRISSTLAPISGMAQTPPPPLVFLSNAYMLPGFIAGMVSAPLVRELLKKVLELAEENEKINLRAMAYTKEMMNLGYPLLYTPATFPAFDWISDTLRGLRGTMVDMYQVPDKLLATIEMFIPLTIGGAVAWAKQTGSKGVFIAMHRGAGGFMSDDQFAEFYWPTLRATFMAMIEEGLVPMPFAEGRYTLRLKQIADTPSSGVAWYFDQTDMELAKETLKGICCIAGNVPSSLIMTSTPEVVKAECRKLIETCAPGGGYILAAGASVEKGPIENLKAMMESAYEYGVY